MATQTFHYSDSLDDFHKGFIERLMALSKPHNLLTRTVWQDFNLHDVVLPELPPHGSARKTASASMATTFPSALKRQ